MSAEDFVIEMNNPLLRTSSGRLPYGETIVCYELARWNWQGIPTWKNPFTKWDGRSTIGMFYDGINRLWHPEDITRWAEASAGDVPTKLVPYWVNDWRLSHVDRTDTSSIYRYRYAVEPISSSPDNTSMFVSAVFKKGTAKQSTIHVYDFTASTGRGGIKVDWENLTVSPWPSTADDYGCFWLDNDTIWVWFTTPTLVVANNNEVLIYPEVKQANPGGSVYVTAVQAGRSDDGYRGPYPYSATGIGSSRLMYQIPVPEDGTIQMWVMTPYPGSRSHNYGKFFNWVENTKTGTNWYTNNRFDLYWTSVQNQLYTTVIDSGGTNRVATPAFNPTSWTDFEWHHVVMAWSGIGSSGSLRIHIDGIKELDQVISTHTFDRDLCSCLLIGCNGNEKNGPGEGPEQHLNGWLGEFALYTEQKSEAWVAKDYARTRPLYEPNRILLTDSEAMISPEGWAVRNLSW